MKKQDLYLVLACLLGLVIGLMAAKTFNLYIGSGIIVFLAFCFLVLKKKK